MLQSHWQNLAQFLATPVAVTRTPIGHMRAGPGATMALRGIFTVGPYIPLDLWQVASFCGVLPGKPLRLNETWTHDVSMELADAGQMKGLTGTRTARLDGVETGEGRARAWVSQYAVLTLPPSGPPPAEATEPRVEALALQVWSIHQFDTAARRLVGCELSLVEDAELLLPVPTTGGGQGLARFSIKGARMHATITARPPLGVPDE
jgi:hypothetical protein